MATTGPTAPSSTTWVSDRQKKYQPVKKLYEIMTIASWGINTARTNLFSAWHHFWYQA